MTRYKYATFRSYLWSLTNVALWCYPAKNHSVSARSFHASLRFLCYCNKFFESRIFPLYVVVFIEMKWKSPSLVYTEWFKLSEKRLKYTVLWVNKPMCDFMHKWAFRRCLFRPCWQFKREICCQGCDVFFCFPSTEQFSHEDSCPNIMVCAHFHTFCDLSR